MTTSFGSSLGNYTFGRMKQKTAAAPNVIMVEIRWLYQRDWYHSSLSFRVIECGSDRVWLTSLGFPGRFTQTLVFEKTEMIS